MIPSGCSSNPKRILGEKGYDVWIKNNTAVIVHDGLHYQNFEGCALTNGISIDTLYYKKIELTQNQRYFYISEDEKGVDLCSSFFTATHGSYSHLRESSRLGQWSGMRMQLWLAARACWCKLAPCVLHLKCSVMGP